MSSTITNAVLRSVLTETITFDGRPLTVNNTINIAGINEFADRTMTALAASPTTLVSFGTTRGAGTYIKTDVRYIRIVNKDNTNFVRLRITKATADTVDVKIPALGVYILYNTSASVSATAGAFSAFIDFTDIIVQADTADCDVDILVASV